MTRTVDIMNGEGRKAKQTVEMGIKTVHIPKATARNVRI